MASDKADIIVVGATGFTGQLIVKYLASHPQRQHFSFGVAGRSEGKLKAVVDKFGLTGTAVFRVDVTDNEQVDRLVQSARVIINVVGPYWTWGTPVVRACVRHGIHYVDLSGESPWIMNIIKEFDFAATKTGAIIVPSCGYDSIPSDASAYLSNQTLKSISTDDGYLSPGQSTSAHSLYGGFSGGTMSTMITHIEDVDLITQEHALRQYSLSPVVGSGQGKSDIKILYKLAVPGEKTLTGSPFVMSAPNKRVVQRTFGLLELDARESPSDETSKRRYGSEFEYDEFLLINNTLVALIFTSFIALVFGLLSFKPTRAIIKQLVPQPGEGPSEETQKKGWFKCLNITQSTSNPPVFVKTTMEGHGDPGYSCTAVMISECALSLLLPAPSQIASLNFKPNPGHASNIDNLSSLARRGGVLTPMTAFGDVLIQRLKETERFKFSSTVIP